MSEEIEVCECGHLKQFHKYGDYNAKKRKTRGYCKFCDCQIFVNTQNQNKKNEVKK